MTLCSKCGESITKVVAIDIDGTISDYHRPLLNHVVAYYNLPKSVLDKEPWDGKGNFEDWLGISQADYREAKLAYRQGGFKRWSPQMSGLGTLLSTCKQLKDQGLIEVWITTTRPWNRLDSVDPDTRFWLDQHFPVYDHLLYDDHKYLKLAELVDPSRVVMVVDDLPEMHEDALTVFDEAACCIVRRPHNTWYSDNLRRGVCVDNLASFAGRLQERILNEQTTGIR